LRVSYSTPLPGSPLVRFLVIRLPPTSTLFPYTTLFRSERLRRRDRGRRSRRCGPRHLPRTRRAAGRAVRQEAVPPLQAVRRVPRDRKSTRLNSSHVKISYAVFCLKKKKKNTEQCSVDTT